MLLLPLLIATSAPSPQTPDLELFEASVRPVLVERCYRCHNSVDRRESGLALDHARGLLEGGDGGPAIVPGDPDASLLMRAVRHADGAPRMPDGEPTLEPHELTAFAEWIERGAPDPRDAPPSAAELAAETSWEAVRERRLAWWSFQPITDPALPEVADPGWPRDPLDRFVLAALEAHGATPAGDVDREALLRRASFVLTGLPPSAAERAAFLADDAPDAYEHAVDRLLASPHYAERFARHWMDLVRYAETHGSEGDPTIPEAYRYRDALVRAFDADVPWDRLVREHVAGDLLEPRVDPVSGINDAEVALAHLRFVQHGYAPTEPLVDQIQFIDNQIDVLSKAFLGLTVSCARCHDHKFDPVSQRDYYALYGVLVSARPALRTVDSAERRRAHVDELRATQAEVRSGLVDAWRGALPRVPDLLRGDGAALEEARKAGHAHALAPWAAALDGADVAAHWTTLVAEVEAGRERLAAVESKVRWRLGTDDARSWYAHGSILENVPVAPGAFAILPEGERILATVLPAGVYSHLLSDRHSGALTSPTFEVDGGALWIRALGGGGARARYAMQNHPRVSGPTYHAHGLNQETARWLRWDMKYWAGDRAYLELATARDIPVEARGNERSHWGLLEARVLSPGMAEPRDEAAEYLGPLVDLPGAPADRQELLERYVLALEGVVERWSRDACSDADTRFLEPFVRHGILPVTLGELVRLAPAVERYRALEAAVPTPVRAPGVVTGERVDQPLFVRGDRRNPSEPVPQSFLEWLDPTLYEGDGRLALARDLTRPDNPLGPRIAVNRMWTWVFGTGLVPTVDNFGLLGAEPSDPALLDHLATRFVRGGWSTKDLLRALVTSRTFRQEAAPRRLDAESIRDALLAVSGRLDRTRLGPSSGERDARRSLYVAQRRGGPPAFLAAFDQPAPNTTVGQRPATNVPAQGLALLNDPLVADCAQAWSTRVLAESMDPDERVRGMFVDALSREPRAEELERALSFVWISDVRRLRAQKQSSSLQQQLDESRANLTRALEYGRTLVRMRRGTDPGVTASALPRPVAAWEFEGDLLDAVGGLHGTSIGAARVADGRLVLDGGFVRTRPLETPLAAKTLMAEVILANDGQRGSGIVSVQDAGGGVFDAIVYSERQPRRWLAGSDNHRRTQDIAGPEESAGEPIHVAITWAADGTITLYRNGAPYGEPYRSGAPIRFEPGNGHVLLGARHGGDDARGPLRGSIERARLFDRALSAEEIAACAQADPNFVSDADARAAHSPLVQAEIADLEQRITDARERLRELEPALAGGAARPWRELAHALFQLEEFRFIR